VSKSIASPTSGGSQTREPAAELTVIENPIKRKAARVSSMNFDLINIKLSLRAVRGGQFPFCCFGKFVSQPLILRLRWIGFNDLTC
jgi:hypothetical protein